MPPPLPQPLNSHPPPVTALARASGALAGSTKDVVLDAIARQPWPHIEQSLDIHGNAVLRELLTPDQCTQIARLYTLDEPFRSKVVMARHGFGEGEYKYFAYPLPQLLDQLRHALYPRLAQVANRWNALLRNSVEFPARLKEFLERCHRAGQQRPTPLLLRYGTGDYNRLHQDLYGEHVFPLQVTILLSSPGKDFKGGEFVMTETRPTSQRAEVVSLCQGDAVVFTVNERPAAGARGRPRRVAMRHGVSRIHSGRRFTVGLIFHDAK
ncbi:MAG: proline hydroxylase [Ramlibacter sp.]|nr:proline hydroxylase [Ramlibacter sp.]